MWHRVSTCAGSNSVPPQIHVRPEPYLLTAILFANKVFADVKMKSYCVTVDPNPKTGDLIRRGRFGH